ncbi:hypothetical protein QQZ08_005194 [Neonectria magnoliae]|uniref:Uncharacterized protein n=1 Tax=Neonectria magnoliae TaxID=2732573 RepID=A0ABR1I5Y7_9HYPO
MGREIVVADRMDLHLLWDNDMRIFLKPIPWFLLDPGLWKHELNTESGAAVESCGDLRKVALGFLYTYACLVSSETDFFVANEKRLLPRHTDDKIIEWKDWKRLVRELLESYKPDDIHPRFLRAELRLSRINVIHGITHISAFEPLLDGWRNYSSFFHNNLAWIAAGTIYIAVMLTAMQLGLATQRLQGNAAFQQASYGFTVFAIIGPICAFGGIMMWALIDLITHLPGILRDRAEQMQRISAADRTLPFTN